METSAFSRRYGSTVLALQRRANILRERLSENRLVGGDTLLLQGDKDDIARLMTSSDLIVTNELTDLYLRKDRAIVALLMILALIFLAAFNIVSKTICCVVVHHDQAHPIHYGVECFRVNLIFLSESNWVQSNL